METVVRAEYDTGWMLPSLQNCSISLGMCIVDRTMLPSGSSLFVEAAQHSDFFYNTLKVCFTNLFLYIQNKEITLRWCFTSSRLKLSTQFLKRPTMRFSYRSLCWVIISNYLKLHPHSSIGQNSFLAQFRYPKQLPFPPSPKVANSFFRTICRGYKTSNHILICVCLGTLGKYLPGTGLPLAHTFAPLAHKWLAVCGGCLSKFGKSAHSTGCVGFKYLPAGQGPSTSVKVPSLDCIGPFVKTVPENVYKPNQHLFPHFPTFGSEFRSKIFICCYFKLHRISFPIPSPLVHRNTHRWSSSST